MANTITVKPGDTLYGLYGPNWKALSGYTGDPSKLKVGTILPAPTTGTGASTSAAAETQAIVDAKYADAASKNPVISSLTKGGSNMDEIIAALSSGNLSGITDSMGMPFSIEDQQKALTQAAEDNKLYYEAMQAKDTADAENALAQKQADYQDYLINSGQQFQSDKNTLDQNAANTGVLFSGGRVQKEKNLERAYNQEQASKLGSVGRDIASTASNFQYNYGNNAAQGLSKYYGLGGNTYNANVAGGGVGSTGLSTIYNPSQYNFQGTQNTARAANANTRAAGLLWNKGNKLLATGLNNQY